MLVGGGVDQLGGDTNPVSGLADASLEHVTHAELARNGRNSGRRRTELKRGSARGDLEPVDASEHVEDLLGDAVGEILLILLGRQVREREHCNRGGGRRSPWRRDCSRSVVWWGLG